MTSMLERPVATGDPTSTPRRSARAAIGGTLPVAGVTAAVWAAALGLAIVGALVLLAWAVSGRGEDSLSTPVSAGGVLWLAAHHAPVDLGAGSISLLPLGLLVIPAVLLVRAGRWAGRISAASTVSDVVLLVGSGAAAYAGIAVGVSSIARIGAASVTGVSALLWSGGLAVLGLALGAVQESGLGAALAARLPDPVRQARPAVLGAVVVLGAGALLVSVVAVALRWSVVAGLTSSAVHGASDGVGLALLSLVYLPNLLVWALAYLAGPGFAVGGGAGADPFSMSGGLLPGMPLLGAVPPDAPAAAPLLLLAPVLAGVVATVLLRRAAHLPLRAELAALGVAVVVIGGLTALLCALSNGSLGWGRLAFLGPHALTTSAAVAGLTAAGALLCSLVVRIMPTVWVREDEPLG